MANTLLVARCTRFFEPLIAVFRDAIVLSLSLHVNHYEYKVREGK